MDLGIGLIAFTADHRTRFLTIGVIAVSFLWNEVGICQRMQYVRMRTFRVVVFEADLAHKLCWEVLILCRKWLDDKEFGNNPVREKYPFFGEPYSAVGFFVEETVADKWSSCPNTPFGRFLSEEMAYLIGR